MVVITFARILWLRQDIGRLVPAQQRCLSLEHNAFPLREGTHLPYPAPTLIAYGAIPTHLHMSACRGTKLSIGTALVEKL